LWAIWETSGIQVNAAGHLVFQKSTASKQPERQEKQGGGPGLDEEENALPEEIAPDQRAVEIDAQDRQWLLGGLGSCNRPHGIIVANGRAKQGNKWDT
jgi:hypothetical protein